MEGTGPEDIIIKSLQEEIQELSFDEILKPEEPQPKKVLRRVRQEAPKAAIGGSNDTISNAASVVKRRGEVLEALQEQADDRALYEKFKAESRKYYDLLQKHEPAEWESYLSKKSKERAERVNGWIENSEWGMKIKDIAGFWIRVSPKYDDDDYDLYDLIRATDKLTQRKGVSDWLWALDQSGKDEETKGKHPHVHLLLLRDTTNQNSEPTRFKKVIKNAYCKLGDVNSHGFIYIKAISEKDIEIKKQYIQGVKTGKEKQQVETISKKWRDELEVPHWFENDEIETD